MTGFAPLSPLSGPKTRLRRHKRAGFLMALLLGMALPLHAQEAIDTATPLPMIPALPRITMPTGGGPALAPTQLSPIPDMRADGTSRTAGGLHNWRPRPRPDRATDDSVIRFDPSTQSQKSDRAATVMADHVTLTGPRTLTAEGDVVVWHQGRRLIASRIRYDGAADRIEVTGPIHLSSPNASGTESEAVLIADSADLDEQLRDGILRGARLMLARKMQLAAREARIEDDGRRTVLDHVVASSCQVCAANPVPLWEIRSRRITHDRDTHRILFEQPRIHAFGVPVMALPWLSIPDPSIDRMTGFLAPRFRTTSGLGPGVKLPYFITLGDSADLTLTPYLALSRTKTLEARYRQALSFGEISISGALSRDSLERGRTRGYLFAAGRFDLAHDWQIEAQIQTASNRAYLLDYGISDADRLWSGAIVSRIRRHEAIEARIGNYHSLREDEDSATIPAQIADLFWQRRFVPPVLGGEIVLEWSTHAHRRPSDDDIIGRDMARSSVSAFWRGDRILAGGILADAQFGLDADLYRIRQDSRYPDHKLRLTPAGAVTLRWPWTRTEANGASHVIEPSLQLAWSPKARSSDDVPNEDSVLWEFDEGNLFSLSRYPGRDARESGFRANIGLGWSRFDPAGWSMSLAAGRVIRHRRMQTGGASTPPAFGRLRSDWLLSANFSNDRGLALAGRALISDSADLSRAEFRAGVLRPKFEMSAGYIWIDGDAEPGWGESISELVLESGWQLAPGWWATGETRYDFSANRAQKAALGVTYRNECVSVDLGVERRFSRSDDLRPETRFDLSVNLGGFGQSNSANARGTVARRSCLR